jgi:hypothetical protein
MIRQAISCDVCGTEKKQTNHWFVAREQGGELHLGGWASRNRSRAGSKHLCGQTCLHKLVDEFMARTISARVQPAITEPVEAGEAAFGTDTSLTSAAAHAEPEPIPRVVAPAMPLVARPALVSVIAGPVAVPAPIQIEQSVVPLADETPSSSKRSWRADAWEREREREQRSAERLQEIGSRHR